MSQDLVDKLKQITKDLLYPSETDAPFDVVCWKGAFSNAHDAVLAHTSGRKKVEQVSINQFFKELAGSEDADRYDQLRQALQPLAQLTVIRLGEIRVEVYLIGLAEPGAWVGVHTSSVET